MQFNRGMVGVLIVVLSLIASVGLGVVTNIETETVTKDVAEYVADITGAYSSGKDQSYTEYNPSKNFNGYTNQTVTNDFAVDFVESEYTNNYPMSYKVAQATSSVFINPHQFATTYAPAYSRYPGWSYNNQTFNGYLDGSLLWREFCSLAGPMNTGNYTFSFYRDLAGVLTETVTDGTNVLGTTPTTITIHIPSTVRTTWFAYEHGYHTENAGARVYYLDNNIFFLPTTSIGTDSELPYHYTYDYLQSIGVNSTFDTDVIYSPSSNTCSIIINGNIVYTGSPSGYSMIYGMPYVYSVLNVSATALGQEHGYTSYSHNTAGNLYAASPTLSVTYSAETITEYIDTRYGVGIRGTESNPETVVWSNDQQNGVTDIAFSTWNASATDKFSDSGSPYSNTGVISYYGTNATDTFTVSRAGGYTYVTLNGGTPVNVGTWNQIQLTFDNINGVLTAHPIQTWDNFNNYSVSPVSVEIGEITKANLSSISWTADNSLRLEVVNTQVFFNTYGVVMVDPEITISNLWPSYDKFMVDITKVATIGDSVTIGADTYDVDGTTVTINDTELDITDLKLYYTKTGTGWNVTAESGKNSTTFSEDSTYLKFTGSWYFISSFYNIVTKQVQERSWDPSTYNFAESHMFFWMAGILLLLSVIGYKLGYLDGLSIIILIATELILLIIGGTT